MIGQVLPTASVNLSCEVKNEDESISTFWMRHGNYVGSGEHLLGKNPSKELMKLHSNEQQVKPNTPTAFIMCSADDTTVPCENSIRYFQALIAAKIPATLHIYPVGEHGWGYHDNFPYKRQWTGELEKWLRELYR